MTAPVTRQEFDDYREDHHAAMNTLAKTSEAMNLKVDRIYDMLAGTFERPGLVHRLATVETAQAKAERVTPEEQRALWWRERKTKIVDAVLVTIVVGGLSGLLLLGVRGFIRDAVKDMTAVQSPRGTMIPVERDPTTRLAFTQEH
jgi:hypothetical protein